MQDRAQQLEARISELEDFIRQAEQSLSEFVSAAESQRIAAELDQRRADLEATMTEWEQVSEQIEATA
jgi:ABC-type transporter Mla subunit MlaD